MRKSDRLPAQFPAGAKYVLEAHGPVVHRFVEMPGGGRLALPQRKAATCDCLAAQEISIVPEHAVTPHEPARRKTLVRHRARVLARA